ncbi:MAG: glycosyltransferase family 2 protein [Anaerolineales bacterium]|nr:MAG: glycosyltransferase family 2 protein [Anaerolineales bacterium]
MISVIIPCYNEVGTIKGLLAAIHAQSFPVGQMEVIIADGGSNDGTLEAIEQYRQDHPGLRIQVIPNPLKRIPVALNRSIKASTGGFVIRLDAHSIPSKNYIETCIKVLRLTQAANVGGVWDIRPGDNSGIARAIAVAAAHPLGAGDARYRVSGVAGPADTVPFGAFRREWLERVGPFNEQLLTNEDYEYNVRIRNAGGTVWFDPDIRSIYYARASLTELARQYWRYGFWKLRMLQKYPRTLRWRQAIPPVFVFASVVLAASAPFFSPARWLLAVQLGAYLIVSFVAGIQQSNRAHDPSLVFGFPLAIWTMHYAWGAGFLWGWLNSLRRDRASGFE